MPLSEPQQTWLVSAGGKAATRASFVKEQATKELLLDEMAGNLENEKESIRRGMTFTVKDKSGKELKSITNVGDYENAIETEDTAKEGYQSISPEDRQKSQKAMEKVLKLRDRMQAQTVERTTDDGRVIRVPMFTEEELANEFYEPLIREGLVGDNVVIGKYSNVQKMLDETNKIYVERLDEEREKEQKEELEAKDLISGGSVIATNLAEAFGGEHAKLAVNAIKLVELTMTVGNSVFEAYKASDVRPQVDSLRDTIGEWITTGLKLLPESTGMTEKLAAQIGQGYKAASSAGKVVECFTRKPLTEKDISEAVGVIGDGFIGGFNASGNTNMKQVGAAVGSSFKAVSNVPTLYKACKDGNFNDVVKQLGAVAKGVVDTTFNSIKADGKLDEESKESKNLDAIQKRVNDALTTGATAVITAKLGYDVFMEKQIDDAANKIIANVANVIKGTMEQINPDVAKTYGNAFVATASAVVVARQFKAKKYEDGINAFASAFKSTFDGLNPDPKNPALKSIGTGIEKGFKSLAKAAAVQEAMEKGKSKDVVKIFKEAAELAVSAVLDIQSSTEEEPKDPAEKKKRAKERKEFEEAMKKETTNEIGEQLGSITEGRESLKELLKTPQGAKTANDKGEKEVRKKVEEELALAREEAATLKKEADEAIRSLAQGGEGGAQMAKLKSIEKLIEEVERNRMILETAATLSKGGMAVATKFYGPLEAAGSAISFVTNVLKAAERADELLKWADSVDLGSIAESNMTPAMKNFTHNQGVQLTHYTIQAACDFAQTIGALVGSTGIAAAAGVAVSKVAQATSAAATVLYKVYRKRELESAWSLFKESLYNPENRKLGQRVRQENSTLAKYTLAWGAMEKRDPIALRAIDKCGLNELTLSDPGSNVKTVEKFLEVYYKEDVRVIKNEALIAKWRPDDISLTAKSWDAAARAAKKDGDLKDDPPSAIVGGFAQIEVHERECLALEQAKNPLKPLTPEHLDDYILVLDNLEKVMSSYKPTKRTNAAQHTEMLALVDEYKDLIGAQAAEVRAKKTFLITEDEPVVTPPSTEPTSGSTSESGERTTGGTKQSQD
jgi:hypothetical protein